MIKLKLIVLSVTVIVLAVALIAQGSEPLWLLHETPPGGATPAESSARYIDDISWLAVANAGRPFGRASGGVIGDKLYVFGGIDSPLAMAFSWDTEHWQMSTEPPAGNCNWCGVSDGESIYLIGRYADYTFGAEVQKFTPIGAGPTGTWENLTDYPLAVAGLAAAWDGGEYIYCAGGSNLTDIFSDAYRYNIAANEWEAIAPLPLSMTYCGGHFARGLFHVAGGAQGDMTEHFVYNPATNSWSEKAPLLEPVPFATFCLSGDDEFMVTVGGGGGYHIWPGSAAVQVYDLEEDSWSYETPSPLDYGLNLAEMMPDQSLVTTGGFDGVKFYQYTYKGTGLAARHDVHEIPQIEQNLVLYPVYPNPFNGSTCIQLALSQGTTVSSRLVNLEGQVVMQVVEGWLSTGIHEFPLDVMELPTGMYVLIVQSNSNSAAEKLLLIK